MKLEINIRSLFKKPVNAREAAERKDTAITLTLGSVAAAIVFTVLGGLLKASFFEDLGYLMILPAVGFFVVWYFVRGDVKRLENTFCACGKKFRFPENVTYEITREQPSHGTTDKGTITNSMTAYVAVTCKCDCGKTHRFDHAFVTERSENNKYGAVLYEKKYPLEESLAGFFRE